MFAGETNLDQLDLFLNSHIGEWIILKWRDDLFAPPMQQAFGSHLASYVVCPHGTEIRSLNYSWLYCDHDNRIFRVGELLSGIGSTWFFKYSTLRQFESAPLSPQDVAFLQLPNLDDVCHPDLSPDTQEIRSDLRLHPFRHPGYPDDVSVTCGPSIEVPDFAVTMKSEQVWVRLTQPRGPNQFTGVLLNQPSFSIWEKGQTVGVHLLQTKDGHILVCGQDK